jgi:signal transduction histidine kinase
LSVRRRLYHQIYLAFVGILVLSGVLISAAWWLVPGQDRDRGSMHGMSALIGESLPAPERPLSELQAKVDWLGAQFDADVTVRSADGALLAHHGDPLPPVPSGRLASGWLRGPDSPGVALHLDDGRWTIARFRHRHAGLGLLGALAILAGVIAVGAYPLARRITRRLERLQARVDALGAGDLKARVRVHGCDEVAQLARSFNRAADRIERLVEAHKSVLASVSHELRSPLTRIRMALELLPAGERSDLKERVAADIAELDDLIGELLLASRLDALDGLPQLDDVDMLALLAEEAARTGTEVSGEAVQIRGDARMLRRLIRNLLENAHRHAGGSVVEASVTQLGDGRVRLTVADRGPGVPESERNRIFEPFYRPPGAKESDGGVGLGLALVRQIAQRHFGDVRYAPRDGGGSVFEVELRGATESHAIG